MRAIPLIAAQHGDDAFYLGLALIVIFGLAAITSWIINIFLRWIERWRR